MGLPYIFEPWTFRIWGTSASIVTELFESQPLAIELVGNGGTETTFDSTGNSSVCSSR